MEYGRAIPVEVPSSGDVAFLPPRFCAIDPGRSRQIHADPDRSGLVAGKGPSSIASQQKGAAPSRERMGWLPLVWGHPNLGA